MLQATKNKYTVETLKPLNILYDHEHWLTQQDVDMANGYVELIERTRSEKTPQIGDRLIYVDRYGKYYSVSIRFTTYFLEVFENIWDKIWRN